MTNGKDLPLGVGVIVIKDGKVLIGTRTDNGLICGAGGHIQAGEKVQEAAARELQEEFGIKDNKLYQLGAIQDPEGKWKPSMVFLCTDYEGEPKADEEEMKDARFAGIDELEEMSNLFPCFAASLVLLMDKLGMHGDDISEQNNGKNNGKTLALNTDTAIMKSTKQDGGPGSGNWGHTGRPGVRGGSGAGGGIGNGTGAPGTYKASSDSESAVSSQKKWDNQATPSFKKSTPEAFEKAMREGKSSGKAEDMWRVDLQTTQGLAENHPKANLKITENGSTIAVDDGDIIGVCSKAGAPKSEGGRALLKAAVEAGGTKLDSYSGNHAFYTKCGFEPVSWCEFDEQYAPPGWKKGRDKPEPVIFYKYTGRCTAEKSANKFLATVAPSSDYDEAMNARDAQM